MILFVCFGFDIYDFISFNIPKFNLSHDKRFHRDFTILFFTFTNETRGKFVMCRDIVVGFRLMQRLVWMCFATRSKGIYKNIFSGQTVYLSIRDHWTSFTHPHSLINENEKKKKTLQSLSYWIWRLQQLFSVDHQYNSTADTK